ncbi:IclR family transcriptional regulator [Alloyangia pacifica]|uniref:Transcriptional regulator, IclR family n=1 Tax=Alloyangia pacifica TaxID=311180 RepID=A0A1I6V0X3_9RHOB|nr:IclR family transcriptional regulator [Alloyangia pacifica]SDI33691.1 transcriptional regulator, IclR family [Alloyangia pacifica]SFT07304.1 transcriptional regulator, IclR family [Alloyangia pacifica]
MTDLHETAHGTDKATSNPLMVHSVEKAFRVLFAFRPDQEELSLSEIAEQTGLNKSAAQRFIHSLCELGFLIRSPSTRRYSLSHRCLSLGYLYASSNTLISRAMPYMMHLSQSTEETVNLTLLDGPEVIFVSRYLSRHMLNTDVVVGSRLPAFCTAPGLAMLASLPEEEADALLEASDLHPFTQSTIWQPDEIRAELARIRRDGYAVAVEQIYPGDLSIAAAVRNSSGRPVAAISVGSSLMRTSAENGRSTYAPLVMAAAHKMSETPNLKRG